MHSLIPVSPAWSRKIPIYRASHSSFISLPFSLFTQMLQLRDGQIRFVALLSIVAGLCLLALL